MTAGRTAWAARLALAALATAALCLAPPTHRIFFQAALLQPHDHHEDGDERGTGQQSYARAYARWKDACARDNLVLGRHDGLNPAFPYPRRPWSLTPHSFDQAAPPEGGVDADTARARCDSLDGLLRAIKEGRRVWPPGLNYDDDDEEEGIEGATASAGRSMRASLARESQPSSFQPAGCDVPYLDRSEACAILGGFSSVALVGDSLMRHAAQGFLMLLTGDWATGAFPPLTLTSDAHAHYGHGGVGVDGCRCDGQFSENDLCRTLGQRAFARYHHRVHDEEEGGEMLARHLCPEEHIHGGSRLRFETDARPPFDVGELAVWDGLCDAHARDEDGRPVLVVLGGGAHYRSDAPRAMREVVDAAHRGMARAKEACNGTLEFAVLWTGLNAQSRSLDARFPHQSRENASAFNAVVDGYAQEHYGDVAVDFWNLTRDAMTSDGYHYLSEVNLYKANALLQAARLLLLDRSREERERGKEGEGKRVEGGTTKLQAGPTPPQKTANGARMKKK